MQSQPRYKKGDKIGGRYQVHKALMGGMGEVYLCLNLEEMIPYALKTFQQRYQTESLRQAFEQEVATWVALERHPNIVRCYWMQELDNQPFMCLDWINGEEGKGSDLRGWLRHGPLNLQLALEITLDIVYGLIHAQQKQPGIVHRDLKPENILMAQGGLAKITDFGLAQIIASEERTFEHTELTEQPGKQHSLIQRGSIVGTPAYMPPEQWRGEQPDERSDIYALGCMLYELVIGHPLFHIPRTATTRAQFQQWLNQMQHLHETSPLPPLPETLPTAFIHLLSHALAKTVSARPTTLNHFCEQLSQLYQQQFAQAPPARHAPDDFTALDYADRDMTYQNLKCYEMALADYDRAIGLNSKLATAYYNRGNTYRELEQHQQALADYNRAIEINPKDFEAYNNRGNTYRDLQQPQQALVNYNRAIEINPKFAEAYSNRGTTYTNLQQHQQALANFAQAIELAPKFADAYIGRGIVYSILLQYRQALVNFNQGIKLHPKDANAYYNRGLTYSILQQYQQALADYDRAIEINPKDVIYVNRGITYNALEKYQEALADFNQAIKLNPKSATAYANRGATYSALQQSQRAFSDFNRAIELDPEDATTYFNFGVFLATVGQLRKAIPYFEQAAQLGLSHAYRAITQVRQMLGD